MKKTIYIISILIFLIGCNTKIETPLSEKLDKDEEVFLINNKLDTLIEGKEGTLIFIEKASFINQYGKSISDSVKIVLKEVYQIEDIIAQKISMKSNGKILETGGMINLQAFSGDDQLKLNYGKEVIIHFPKNENKEMNLFYGKTDSSQIVEWEIEEASTYRLIDSIQPWYTKYDHPKVDDGNLYLNSGEIWYNVLPNIFQITEKEKEELLNKTIHLNYIITKDGKLKFQNTTGSKISRKFRKRLENVVKNFPRCQPFTRGGIPMDMKGFFKIFTKVLPPNYQSKTSYLESIEQKLVNGNSKGLELAELQYYIFDSKNLGWMNCDRFINSSAEKVNYVVKVPKSKNVFAKIIFTDYKTVMTGDEKRGRFIFNDLPINEPVKIVVIDEKKGKPLLQIVDTKTTKEPIEIKHLKEYTLEDLKEKLKELN